MADRDTVLDVRGLCTSFGSAAAGAGAVTAVNDASFSIRRGETLVLVGESGCGKSVTSHSLMRLLPASASLRGEAWLTGRDGRRTELLSLGADAMRRVRGRELGMIFQEPMTSLNPLQRVGDQIAEPLLAHGLCSRGEARRRAIELLRQVGIAEAETRAIQYPHQMSGGMRQRVMIASALACRPSVLIADEPTTALDVTVQAQILRLIRRLQREMGMAVLFITHDMGVVSQIADRVAVMYGGRLVEVADKRTLFTQPRHPYTRGLLAAVPDPRLRGRLQGIPGQVEPSGAAPGCGFARRCAQAGPACFSTFPAWVVGDEAHAVACHHPDPLRSVA